MQDRDFQAKILGIQHPWHVVDVKVSMKPKRVETFVEFENGASCPVCAKSVPKHDHRERRWRHLDIYEFEAFVVARIPRVDCPEHGVQQLPVDWADGRTGFTALFERLAISLLREMSILAVARMLRLSWDEVDTIMDRAVRRGVQRRSQRPLRFIGIDEKSVKKRHKYFTIVTDLERSEVVWIGRGRKRETVDAFWAGLSADERSSIEGIAMDMWPPYIESTLVAVPAAAQKIVFDKFHIIKHLVHAVDLTRRSAVRVAGGEGTSLKHTRYQWLRRTASKSHAEKLAFAAIRRQYGAVARAWSIKELFARLWEFRYEGAARNFFNRWYGWAVRARLRHIAAVAKMIKRHLDNILTYLRIPITNATSESMNSKIQKVKFLAHGFRNEERFQRAIFFHCGGLDLYPTHTNV